jgi:hypothetical protein
LNLENIKEVGGGGVHFNDILVVFGDGIREVRDLELFRAL